MKHSALVLTGLWSYSLAVTFFGSKYYWPTQIHFSEPTMLLVIAAFGVVPIVASIIVFMYKSKRRNDEVSISFVRCNQNQLIAYGIGVLLMTIKSGAGIIMYAQIAGFLINIVFLTKKCD